MKMFARMAGQESCPGLLFILFVGGFFTASTIVLSDLAASEKGSVKRGARVYMDNCTPCHGIDGDGQGPLGPKLGARDFSKGKFKKGSSDEQLFNTISEGIPPKMPTWKKKLTPQQRRDVAAFIRTFSKKK